MRPMKPRTERTQRLHSIFGYLSSSLAIAFSCAIVASFFISSASSSLADFALAAAIAAGVIIVGWLATKPKPG